MYKSFLVISNVVYQVGLVDAKIELRLQPECMFCRNVAVAAARMTFSQAQFNEWDNFCAFLTFW